uniref:Maestro heat-like repeat family member 1 n=1 Tax=Oreochromis niloticus TaxID=8128 RepID=A0A669D564_ORENI
MAQGSQKVTLALLDAATDKDSEVQEQVRKSILTLGKQQPDRVLAMCQDYLLKHPKLVVTHRVVILRTIELIVGCRIEEISPSRIKSIISLASDEMTRSKVIPDWQQAASNILVAVGNKHINDIMEEILSKFQPGVLPHFFVVQTLANLSDSNVYGMVPFLNAILGTMLPMLSMAKQDNMKWVFSSALSHFSDSILEYLANLDKAPDPSVRKDTFSSDIYAAFEILFNNWLQSREPKLRLTVAEAVGSMCHLMASDKLEEQIPRLVPAILSLYKKNNEHYIISKSLCQVLDASFNMGSRVLETQLEALLFALHQQVSAPVDYSNPPTVKNHNEVLRCFSLIANSFPDRLVMFVLQKLENSNERSRMGSLAVLRHLINSSTSTMESKKLLILASIRQPMADHSNKVKKRVVQVISAMAHHGYLELEGGELLVRFIVQHCALPDTYQRSQRPTDPEEVTNESLRSMCDNTLHLLTTTVGRLADVLWPKLLYYLTPSQYSNATTPLCKSLIVLGNKKKNNQEPSFKIDFTQEALDDDKWVCQLAAESTRYLPTYNNALEEKSFLYRCIGVTLQHCFNKELVKKQLHELLLAARHNDAVEREGVAMGVGLCANSHLEGTLAKLDEFGKSDAFKKSPSIFNLLKERNDVEVEKVKSTLILCYGQVAVNAPPEKILNRIDQDILRCISKHFNTKVWKHCYYSPYIIWSKWHILNAVSPTYSGASLQALYKDTLAALQELLKSVLAKDPTPDGLQNVFKHIESWLSSGQDHERERAITATAHILAYYLDNLTVKNMVSFHNLGALLGRLSPRCSDPVPAVRAAAVDCIHTLLYIQLRYEGFSLDYKDESVDSLLSLKDRLENPDHSVLYKTCSDLTKRLPQQQLTTLVFMLFEGLVDSQTNCCRASTVILNTLLKNRGGGLQDMGFICTLLRITVLLYYVQVRVAVGQTVLILASQHLQTVINTLVNQPLPYDNWISEMWMALGADPIVANQIMEMVMEKLSIMAPYVDKKESFMRGGTTKVATNQPLAVTFVCLVLRAMAKHAGPRLPAIVECLCPLLNNIYECQRITVTAFFSELLNHHVVTELMLVDVLMNNMMERISDPCCTVRMLAVRGLGNIAVGSPEKVHTLTALTLTHPNCYDIHSKLITLEAMSGLSKVLVHLDKKNVHLLATRSTMFWSACCYTWLIQTQRWLRYSWKAHTNCDSSFLYYCRYILVLEGELLHAACKYAMRVCAPVVGSEQITAMFQNHLHEDKSLHYGEFINDLTKYLIQDFPGMLNFYHISVIQFFKSNWPEVRAGAAMFIGITAL